MSFYAVAGLQPKPHSGPRQTSGFNGALSVPDQSRRCVDGLERQNLKLDRVLLPVRVVKCRPQQAVILAGGRRCDCAAQMIGSGVRLTPNPQAIRGAK
jgi:hypothetical protein